jgi:hypothetical protein
MVTKAMTHWTDAPITKPSAERYLWNTFQFVLVHLLSVLYRETLDYIYPLRLFPCRQMLGLTSTRTTSAAARSTSSGM